MARVVVVVPTHDHAEMLRSSVGSALAQTATDLDVVIVGDGVSDVTREVVAELRAADRRVRFVDRPKGPRCGERWRHPLLCEAEGDVVCYLSDDDLLLPNHVELMCELLEGADFAHALPVLVHPDGSLLVLPIDLRRPQFRVPRVPLTGAAHTLGFYRSLPHGWRDTPEGVPTDRHMWEQMLAQPGCRPRSSFRLSALVFPSPLRSHLDHAGRVAELERWAESAASASWREQMGNRVLESVVDQWATLRCSKSLRVGEAVKGAARPVTDLIDRALGGGAAAAAFDRLAGRR